MQLEFSEVGDTMGVAATANEWARPGQRLFDSFPNQFARAFNRPQDELVARRELVAPHEVAEATRVYVTRDPSHAPEDEGLLTSRCGEAIKISKVILKAIVLRSICNICNDTAPIGRRRSFW